MSVNKKMKLSKFEYSLNDETLYNNEQQMANNLQNLDREIDEFCNQNECENETIFNQKNDNNLGGKRKELDGNEKAMENIHFVSTENLTEPVYQFSKIEKRIIKILSILQKMK